MPAPSSIHFAKPDAKMHYWSGLRCTLCAGWSSFITEGRSEVFRQIPNKVLMVFVISKVAKEYP